MREFISGIHHVSLSCRKEEVDEVLRFYSDTLGLDIVSKTEECILFNAGNFLIEIFVNNKGIKEMGAIRHFAFAVTDTDACAEKLGESGYSVFLGPVDVSYPARIAFCKGPLGEEIEFFEEY